METITIKLKSYQELEDLKKDIANRLSDFEYTIEEESK